MAQSITEPTEEKEWVSIQWVARELELSQATVRRMVKKGDIPAFRIGGEYRIRATEYKEWLLRQRVNPQD